MLFRSFANLARDKGFTVDATDFFRSHGRKFKKGGETSKTGIHWLDGESGSPERVLSAEQTKDFNKLVDVLSNSNFQDILKSAISPMSGIATPKIPNVTARQGITLQIDNFIKADTITKDSIPELKKIQVNAMEDLKNLLNKNGVRPSLI